MIRRDFLKTLAALGLSATQIGTLARAADTAPLVTPENMGWDLAAVGADQTVISQIFGACATEESKTVSVELYRGGACLMQIAFNSLSFFNHMLPLNDSIVVTEDMRLEMSDEVTLQVVLTPLNGPWNMTKIWTAAMVDGRRVESVIGLRA